MQAQACAAAQQRSVRQLRGVACRTFATSRGCRHGLHLRPLQHRVREGTCSPVVTVQHTQLATASRPPHRLAAASSNAVPEAASQGNFWACVFTLMKVIIGAGMMAIPKAFYMMGSLLGSTMLVLVAMLTYWTKAVMVQGAESTKEDSYAGLAARTCGPLAEGALQLGLFGFCFGVMAVYLVVIGDILAGTPGMANGLVSELLGITSGPMVVRNNAVLAVAAVCCAPLVSLRSMDKLAAFNTFGVAATAMLAITAAILGLAAVASGQVQPIPLLPQWHLFGDTSVKIAMALAGVIPVVLNCYVGHQSVFSIMKMLQPYSSRGMKGVVAAALAGSAAIFFVLAFGSLAAFGANVDPNILNNLSKDAMSALLGGPLAQVFSVVVRGGFLISLLGSYVLLMYPLRSCIAELVWGKAATVQTTSSSNNQLADLENKFFVPLTYGILASTTAVAVLVPNIWAALSVVGDLASTVQAFILPALIGLAMAIVQPWKKQLEEAGGRGTNIFIAVIVLVLGVSLFANGIIQRVGA